MKETRLIVVRHGNTFIEGDIVTRIGKNTDIPLVETLKSENIGQYLIFNNLFPDIIFTGPMQRQYQTAELIIKKMNLQIKPTLINDFSEIDYGIDENKQEKDVLMRIGKQAIKLWDEELVVPVGWNVDVQELKESWRRFLNHIENEYCNKEYYISN